MPILTPLKKLLKFINDNTIVAIIAFLAGFAAIKLEMFGKTNWPTVTGTPAVIIGWAFIGCGIWFLYFGIRKGLKNLKDQQKS